LPQAAAAVMNLAGYNLMETIQSDFGIDLSTNHHCFSQAQAPLFLVRLIVKNIKF
jgi:hypothetical protein